LRVHVVEPLEPISDPHLGSVSGSDDRASAATQAILPGGPALRSILSRQNVPDALAGHVRTPPCVSIFPEQLAPANRPLCLINLPPRRSNCPEVVQPKRLPSLRHITPAVTALALHDDVAGGLSIRIA